MIKHLASKKRFQFLFIVLISLFAGPIVANKSTQNATQKNHFINSPASCTNVSYGKLGQNIKLHPSDADASSDRAWSVVSPNSNGPVIVDIGIFILEVTDIDEVANTFTVKGFMDLIWCDPRHSYNFKNNGNSAKYYQEDNVSAKIAQMWQPGLHIVNAAGAHVKDNSSLVIQPDGTIDYRIKFDSVIEGKFDLVKFPYDKQNLKIDIQSFLWKANEMVLHQNKKMIGFSTEFEIPEWHIVSVESKIKSVKESWDKDELSKFFLTIHVKRLSGFYFWKVLAPMMLILGASWSVFWMMEEDLSARIGVSLSGILTVVAFQFLLSDTLPKVSYLTFLDVVMLVSFIWMSLTVVQNIAVKAMFAGQPENAIKFDKTCRWVFPYSYIITLSVLIIIYFVL